MQACWPQDQDGRIVKLDVIDWSGPEHPHLMMGMLRCSCVPKWPLRAQLLP